MLLALIVLPIVAGFGLFAIAADDRTASKAIGCTIAAITFFGIAFSRGADVSVHWLARPFSAAFHFGADGLGYWIALLLALCTFCAILSANVARLRTFVAFLLLLEGAMLGLFLARDLLVFALCWDLMLIPVFFTLLLWGAHRETAWRYLIYNFAGGLTLLLATAAFGVLAGSTDVLGAHATPLIGGWAPWIFAGFAFAFAVKTPVWPLHTWMPATYADTPPAMVAVVSAIQSKAGLYGFIVIGLPFLAENMRASAPLFIVLGLIALLYGALIALVQSDMKRIVAYSSLSHLGLILVAIFSQNPLAIEGAQIYIIAHGLFSAALFLVLGYIEEREETRTLSRLGGMMKSNPRLAGAFTIAALAALGLPGLAGFAGEIVILSGVYASGNVWPALIALVPIVIAAAYMLRLLQQTIHGPDVPDLPVRGDLTWAEGLALAPLVAGLVVLGVNPHAIVSAATAVIK